MNTKQILTLAVLAVAVLGFAPAVVLGAAPQPPASYYGQVLVDGEPAAAGVEIIAYLDGTARGNITTGVNGTFGGPGTFDEKLDVEGTSDEEGNIVQFEVGETMATTTVSWSPGDLQQLTIRTGAIDGSPPIIAAVSATDTDGDRAVADGDRITVSVEVTDNETGVQTVTADASAFGAGSVNLTETSPGTYQASFVVDRDRAGPTGSHAISITAVDQAGNSVSGQTSTLELRDPTTVGSGQPGLGIEIGLIAILLIVIVLTRIREL